MKRYPVVLETVGLVAFAAIGVLAAKAFGLLDAAHSPVMKMGLGGGAAYFFAMSFWAALHQ